MLDSKMGETHDLWKDQALDEAEDDFERGAKRATPTNSSSASSSGSASVPHVSAAAQRARQFRRVWRQILTAYTKHWRQCLRFIAAGRFELITPPQSNAAVREATWEWVALLRTHPDGDPFKDWKNDATEFLLQPLLGQVRMVKWEPLLGQMRMLKWKPLSPEDQNREASPDEASPDKVGFMREEAVEWEETIFDELPLDVLTRPHLTQVPLSDLSQEDLDTLATYLDWQGLKIHPATLREHSRLVRRNKPAQGVPSRESTGQPPANLPLFRGLSSSLINTARLRPSPLNLVRFYQSGRATELQREQILCALTGWVSASNKERFVTGETQGFSPATQNTAAPGKRESDALLGDNYASREFMEVLIGYVAQTCETMPPPPPLIETVSTRAEALTYLSTIPSYASNRAALWAYFFVTETMNLMGKQERLRRGTNKEPWSDDFGETQSAPIYRGSSPERARRARPLVDLSPGELGSWEARKSAMRAAIALLTAREKEAFLLQEVEELSITDIAIEMKVAVSSVKTLLQRARRRIRGQEPPTRRQRKPRPPAA